MIEKFKQCIKNHNLFDKKDKLLIAISGGPDSMCVFHMLYSLGYKLELAHCNFSLRGKDSDDDEKFIKTIAKEYHLKLYSKLFEVKKYAKKNKLSVQMAARDLRYAWFEELSITNNIDYIITAHHKDDNVETFFINLIRGTGIHGLKGIKFKNNKIVRPLLEFSKKEIEDYLKHNNFNYRIDSSNSDSKYLRNKIRHQLIPLIEEMNPNIISVINNEISIFKNVVLICDEKIRIVKKELLKYKQGVYSINIKQLLKLESFDFYLYYLLSPFGFFNIDQIIKSINSQSGKQFFSHTHQLIVDRDFIFFTDIKLKESHFFITPKEKKITNPLEINFTCVDSVNIKSDYNIAYLDFEKLNFPLILRKWQAGDKFKPLGMNNYKKLSDFFIDEKIHIIDKKKQWLLCSGNKIVWVVGRRIDDRFKIDTNTKKVYIAELLK